MDVLLILALALIADFTLGDPPDAFHPVAWMGKVISLLERGGLSHSPLFQFIYGVVITLLVMALFTLPVYFLLLYLKDVSFAAYVLAGAVLLKLTFSLRGLENTVHKIKRLLLDEKLDQVRFELRALVSRDTSSLSKPLLISAAVESTAESICDSFVAPLFYFLFLGIPGVFAYRVVNTLDSMIGYHGKYEYLGKFPSRLDDMLNFIPARLTALLLVLAAFFSRRSGRRSWQVALGDHSKTESPNAGWPMAAAAGALNIQLEKVGHYKLGRANAPLVPETVDESLSLVQIAAVTWILACFAIEVIYLVYST
ncbi:MAG TPA: cobalamin biosynthesis protein [Dehalococcoidia bacterium]|nr:cobalamin biosynthesis protein [Dehalococcoidia bacterium]